MTQHQLEHKCPCLPCRQDRVRTWVGNLFEWGIPENKIRMEINQYGGRVIIYSGNQNLDAHHTHKEKWCYQFNERSLEFAKTWWLAHHQQTTNGEKVNV